MCRLGGVVMTDRPRTVEFYDEVAVNLLALLTNMEAAFGGDGVSITFHYPDGRWHTFKDHRKVQYMYARYQAIRDSLEGAVIVQMHARKATGGSSLNHDNLHPFYHSPIVGCHNGVVMDRPIWQKLEAEGLKPYSQVDSEAIFAMMSLYAPKLTPDGIQRVVNEIDGNYAITAVSTERPHTLMLLAQENPLCFYHDQKRGIVWYASTEDLIPREVLPQPKRKKVTEEGKTSWINLPVTTKLEEGDMYLLTAEKKKIKVQRHVLDVWFSRPYREANIWGGSWDEEYRWELEEWLFTYMDYTYDEMASLSTDELEDLVEAYRQIFERDSV